MTIYSIWFEEDITMSGSSTPIEFFLHKEDAEKYLKEFLKDRNIDPEHEWYSVEPIEVNETANIDTKED